MWIFLFKDASRLSCTTATDREKQGEDLREIVCEWMPRFTGFWIFLIASERVIFPDSTAKFLYHWDCKNGLDVTAIKYRIYECKALWLCVEKEKGKLWLKKWKASVNGFIGYDYSNSSFLPASAYRRCHSH